MKFEVDASNLLKCLDRAFGAIGTGKKIDAGLSCYMLEATEGGLLRVYGTDREVSILTWAQTKVTEPGKKLLKAKVLHDVIKALPRDGVVEVSPKKTMLQLKCGKISYAFSTIEPGSDNVPQKIEEVETSQVGRDMLRAMIDQTIYAASVEEVRPNLNGVHFEGTGTGGLRLVATDGHRLAVAEGATGGFGSDFQGFTVPRKGCAEIRKLLVENEKVEIGFDTNRIILRSGDHTILTCQLVDQRFPDWTQVVPKSSSKKVSVNREKIIGALARLKLLQDKASATAIVLNGAQSMTLKATHADLGEGQEEIDVEYDGEGLTVGFNGQYLADACRSFECETLQIELTDQLSPGIVSDPANADQRAVIMPMRL